MTRALIALLVSVSALARVEAPVAPLAFGPVISYTVPAIASDGLQSLVVWNDSRDRATNAVYGARLDANGTLLDPVGVRLMDGVGGPVIAYGDGRYLVVEGLGNYVLVDGDANVVARGSIPGTVATALRVAFNGRDFVVVSGFDSIEMSIVDRDGILIAQFPLVAQQFDVRLHSIAANGSRLVVLFSRGQELRSVVASYAGTLIADAAITTQAFAEVPASVSAVDGGFFAAWQTFNGVSAARLDADGTLVAGPAAVLASGASPKVVGSSLFALEGGIDSHLLVRRTLTNDLAAVSPVTFFESPALAVQSYAPAAAFVIAHIHHPDRHVVEEGLYAIDAAGEQRLVARAGVTQLEPRLATGATGTMLAWREDLALAAAFLPRTGAPRDFVVANGIIDGHSVAATDDTFLITWSTYEGVFGRIERDGMSSTMTLDPSGRTPVAVSDGNGFVLAWTRMGAIDVLRITTSGQFVAGTSIAAGNVTGLPVPALACDRGECIVAWRNQTATQTCPRIGCLTVDERAMATRLDASLVRLDPVPRVLSDDLGGIVDVTVAANDGQYVVSWVGFGKTYVHEVASGATIVVPGTHPAVTREDDAWLVVREFLGELVALRLRDAGEPYEFTLFRDEQVRTAPAMTRDGALSIVAYERTTRGEAAGGVPRIFVTTTAPPGSRRRAISR